MFDDLPRADQRAGEGFADLDDMFADRLEIIESIEEKWTAKLEYQ